MRYIYKMDLGRDSYSYFKKRAQRSKENLNSISLSSKVGAVSLLCHNYDSSEIHWSYFHLGFL